MPLRLEIKKKLCSRTERVKSVDMHPNEPWALSALYSGELVIYNWKEQLTVKTFEVCPGTVIRCAKFIPQKEWLICGSDDTFIRVFNYHTMEKIIQFDAHSDFIRYIDVHPILPLVLTVSDDSTACLWDWNASWSRIATFEGHTHYVMMCQWNPKDPHIFATASLDKTIKIWGIQSALPAKTSARPYTGTPVVVQPNFNLLGHESGVNCIQYTASGDKPYIASGSDDRTIRLWDYQTKQCVMILTGHTKPIISVTFHPCLPIIISGGEDGLVNIWHINTYRLESSLNYAMGRIWGVTCDETTSAVAFGTDEGTVVLKLCSEKPVASMQGSKIIIGRSTEIQTINVRVEDDALFSDGDRVPSSVKDIGSCEIFPQSISHHPNGRLIAVCGDGEYVIYTAQALRNQAYGKALEFVWSHTGDYAVQNSSDSVSIFQKFKEHITKKLQFTITGIFGGRLLSVAGSDFICFYDWNRFRLIRRIDVQPHGVYWNKSGTTVILACQDSFFSLEYNQNTVNRAWTTKTDGTNNEEVEDAFELDKEVEERVESGVWAGDCFVFTTPTLRVYTLIGGLIDTLAFLDHPCWLLEYFPETNKLYLIDRQFSVVSYKLPKCLLQYQTAICRRDFNAADEIFQTIPPELYNKVAKFLQEKGHTQKALEVTKDLDQKFELARTLGHLEQCAHIIREAQELAETKLRADGLHTSQGRAVTKTRTYQKQWKQSGDLALERGSISLASACFFEAEDVNGLLLIYSSTGDAEGLRRTANLACKLGQSNVAFLCYLLLHDVDQCIRILIATNQVSNAALFARMYAPSRISDVVNIWKKKLIEAKHYKMAATLADPQTHPELFPFLSESLEKEKEFRKSPFAKNMDKETAISRNQNSDNTQREQSMSHNVSSADGCISENHDDDADNFTSAAILVEVNDSVTTCPAEENSERGD